ncbi:hypothetical protein QW131_33955 [Roseibium salinum]|nr:hypothetical protein [Roseibium salinum]
MLAPFAEPTSTRLKLEGPSVELKPQVAVSLGLILQELATNAAKYGAWANENGCVSLHWATVDHDASSFRIDWRETDGPEVEPPETTGFGLEFITRSTEYELHGACKPEFLRDGFRCVLELPANSVLRARPDREP